MEEKVNPINWENLREPFPEANLDWRIGKFGWNGNNEPYAKVLAYLTARDVEDRLDAVVGPERWQNEYFKGPEGGIMCGLAILVNGEWIWKHGVGTNTNFEAVKGGESDAFKRAAVRWGIGRYLYGLGDTRAIFKKDGSGRFKHHDKERKIRLSWDPPPLDEEFLNDADKANRVGTY